MAETEFVTTAADTSPNPNRFDEPRHRPAAFLVWEVSPAICRKVVTFDNTAGSAPVIPGTVLHLNGVFIGILYGRPVIAGVTEDIVVVYRGAAIVKDEHLTFLSVTNAVDGVDAGTDTVAENAAATVALEASLREQMAELGIEIQ